MSTAAYGSNGTAVQSCATDEWNNEFVEEARESISNESGFELGARNPRVNTHFGGGNCPFSRVLT